MNTVILLSWIIGMVVILGVVAAYTAYTFGVKEGKEQAAEHPFTERDNKDIRSAAASPRLLWLGQLYAFTPAQVQVARKRAIENQSDLS